MSLIYKNSIASGGLSLQTYYDSIYPVDTIVIGFNAPTIPSSVTATWTDISSAYTDTALWISSTNDAGTKLKGSLPNITGTIQDIRNGSTLDATAPTSKTGALSGCTTTANSGILNLGKSYRIDNLVFNAGNSNSVYKATAGKDIVRPDSIVVKVYKRTK